MPTVLATVITIFWLVYCFFFPVAFVEFNISGPKPLPTATVFGPWQTSPNGHVARRQSRLDWPFARFTIDEFRYGGSEGTARQIGGDYKWLPIALATLAGVLAYGAAWKAWLARLRKSNRFRPVAATL
ncbi:MAG TPA: hypothetical protein VGG30_07415 [Pirellulales bacterium]